MVIKRVAFLVVAAIGLWGCTAPRSFETAPPAPSAPMAAPEPAPSPQPAVEVPTLSQTGVASWYAKRHNGHRTANGERFNIHALTAAHRTLPFNTIVRVTCLETGHMVKVRVNDRGPTSKKRIIDLATAAGTGLGIEPVGLVKVRIEVFASDQRKQG